MNDLDISADIKLAFESQQAVITELREALAYERRRVDDLLERWVPGG